MTDVDTRLIRCFRAVFPGVPGDKIPQATPETVAAWDSVASVNLLNVVAEEFHLEVDWSAIDELTSFGAIKRMVESGGVNLRD